MIKPIISILVLILFFSLPTFRTDRKIIRSWRFADFAVNP